MKHFRFSRRYNTAAFYTLGVIALGAVIVKLVWNYTDVFRVLGEFLSLLTPFFVGFVIAYLLNPILRISERLVTSVTGNRLSRRTGRAFALVLTYLFAIFILTVFFSIVIPQIATSIASIAGQVPGWMLSLQTLINRLISEYDLYNIPNVQPDIWNKVVETATKLLSTASSMVTNAIPHVLSATMSVTTSLLNVIVGVIISLYLLLSKERFFAQTKKLLSALMPQRVVNKLVEIAHQSNEIFSGFISGKVLDSFIIGLLCFAGMTLLRLPYATLISVIVGVTNVIPYFGPFIGAIPSILILLLIDPIQALWFGIFVLVLQQVDGNIIGPKILGDSTGLSAFWVIFAITVFGSLMGVLGMFIGVPLFAVIYSLIRQFCEWRLAAKGMATRTEDYAADRRFLMEKRAEPKPPRRPKRTKS